jgi:hypothetical protein
VRSSPEPTAVLRWHGGGGPSISKGWIRKGARPARGE